MINISEGRNAKILETLDAAAGASLRDRHSDRDHHRSVFTLINDADALWRDVRSLGASALEHLDLTAHDGVHPRLGVLDVVPFVALASEQQAQAIELRDRCAEWLANEMNVPVFLYGPLVDGGVRTLPEIRRHAFESLAPDVGPTQPSPRWGASAVGQREVLVAWNLWIVGIDLIEARRLARDVRSDDVRALGLAVSGGCQVSCNLLNVRSTRPSDVYDRVQELLGSGAKIVRAELVGLIPRSLLSFEDPGRWTELDLATERTIEFCLGH